MWIGYLSKKKLIITQAAKEEFESGNINFAGPWEQMAVSMLMLTVEVVPNDPSPEVTNLKTTSQKKELKNGDNDRLIFGTAHKRNIHTLTNDDKFRKAARAQGVAIRVYLVTPPISYANS